MSSSSVCIDARMIDASGIGTYLQGLLGALKARPNLPVPLWLLGDVTRLPGGPWQVTQASTPIYSLREQVEIPLAVRRTGAALVHAPHYNMPVMDASRTIVTVHDLIHLKFPQFWPSAIARAYARYFFYRVVPQARHVLTVSENTKKDLTEMLGIPAERITVTYPAVWHERFQSISSGAQASFVQLGLPRDYLLYIGNLKEFKNVERLLDAYTQYKTAVREAPTLVMVGRNFIPGFEERLQQAGVRWIGEVARELLPALYKNAIAFLFPSLYEGFGLPPLEAMASGTPVLCSRRASLPEVVGDAALWVDPENVTEIASGIKRLSEDPALRRDLSAKGLAQAARFSWARMAEQTLQVYQQCA